MYSMKNKLLIVLEIDFSVFAQLKMCKFNHLTSGNIAQMKCFNMHQSERTESKTVCEAELCN